MSLRLRRLCAAVVGMSMVTASWAMGEEPAARAGRKNEEPARTRITGERAAKEGQSQPDRTVQPSSANVRNRQVSVGPPQTAGATSAPLTNETLKTWLEDMGYEPKLDGASYLTNSNMYVELSQTGDWIFVSSGGLAKFADATQAPIDKVLSLMEWNGANGCFYYMSQHQIIAYQAALPNVGVSRASLRRAIENAGSAVSSTYSIWGPLGWAE
jgi:hypothetical protein